MKITRQLLFPLALLAAIPAAAKQHDPPPTTGIGAKPPAGAVVLFDGKDTSAWDHPWAVERGAMVSGGTDTLSKRLFRDFTLHVEFNEPSLPGKTGQGRGNSGVYLLGNYEIQVLDSYGIADPGRGDCGAVYDVAAPLVNACRPPGEWQSYDITFRAARFDASGSKTENARVTVIQNGLVVQNNQDIPHPTGTALSQDESKPGPIRLQYHHNSLHFRNVWVLPLPSAGAAHY